MVAYGHVRLERVYMAHVAADVFETPLPIQAFEVRFPSPYVVVMVVFSMSDQFHEVK